MVTYTDNGVGIAEEEKKLIFNQGFGKNTGKDYFSFVRFWNSPKLPSGNVECLEKESGSRSKFSKLDGEGSQIKVDLR